MSIANVPYTNPTRRGDGEQTDGLAWLPHGILDLAGWATGDIGYGYTYEVYAGLQSWSDGSTYVVKSQRLMEPWRLRNVLRSVKAEFATVMGAIEAAAAEEIGGVAVADPSAAWLDAPMEPDPSLPPPEPES